MARALRRIAVPVLAAAVVLSAPAVAGAGISPQEGIAGAKLGMTQERVRDKLGKPDRERIRTSPVGGFEYIALKYDRTWVSFDGTLAGSEVLSVSTKDPHERTSTGVGVGSTKGEVKEGVPGIRCANEFGVRHCWLGEFAIGEIVTDFQLEKKAGKPARVSRVGVGIVLD